jgi:hypothetical protein
MIRPNAGGWRPPLANHSWPRPIAGLKPHPSKPVTASNNTPSVPGTNSSGSNGSYFFGGWGATWTTPRHWPHHEGRWDWTHQPSFWDGWGSGSGTGWGAYSYPTQGYTESSGDSDSTVYTTPHEQKDSTASSTSSKEDAATNREENAAAKQGMDDARRAFKKEDYAEAQKDSEKAIRLLPGNAHLHEFSALCEFAQGKYQDAAATLYEVLAVEPGWSWDTLSSFYPSARTYIKQLRALEQNVQEHPEDAAARFVLAYHYLLLDERDAAAAQLREVSKLHPKDHVAPGLLEVLEKAKKSKAQTPTDKPAPGGD